MANKAENDIKRQEKSKYKKAHQRKNRKNIKNMVYVTNNNKK